MTKIETGLYGRFMVRNTKLKSSGEYGLAVSFAYDAASVRWFQRTAGCRWLGGDKAWFVPTTQTAALASMLRTEHGDVPARLVVVTD